MNRSDLVVLHGGLTVPRPALELLISLERRGICFHIEADARLTVGPLDRLTDADCEGLRRWKLHVLALLAYEPDVQGVQ